METTVDTYMSEIENSYSWNRVMRVAEFYFPVLRMQLILYPVIALVLFALTLLSRYTWGDTMGILSGGVCSTALSFMFYWAPVALTRRDTRLTETMLPATCAEKSTFLFGYFFLMIPLLLYGVYYGIGSAVIWIFDLHNVLAQVNMDIMSGMELPMWLVYACNVMTTLAPAMTCLWAVLVTPRSRALMGLVWSVVALVALSIISGVYTLVMMFVNGFFDAIMENPSLAEDPEAMSGSIVGAITSVAIVVGAVAFIYNAFAVWKVWRVQSRRQL